MTHEEYCAAVAAEQQGGIWHVAAQAAWNARMGDSAAQLCVAREPAGRVAFAARPVFFSPAPWCDADIPKS